MRAPTAIDVLVLDAQYRQSLACMRVFGRRRLTVGAVACESESWAPSFKSRWSSLNATVPGFVRDENGYLDELTRLIDKHQVKLVIPAHDGSIAALRKRRSELERRTALPIGHERALDIAVSKELTLNLAAELRIRVPRSITARDQADVRAATIELGLPVVVKPVESWVTANGAGERLRSYSAVSSGEAELRAGKIFASGGHVLIQEWLPGHRDAVSMFRSNGRCWATFAQRSRREWPILGGASVFYESIALERDLARASESLIDAMDLDGCSVAEFRRDKRGAPVLMEVNPRMAGSVGLAVSCGVDFPGMLRAWALGEPLKPITSYEVGRRSRWLAGDFRSLWNNFVEQDSPDSAPRASAAATFLTDFVLRPSNIEPFDWADPRPAAAELGAFVHEATRRRIQVVSRRLKFATAGR
ncbi:MAG TPA: ATP-grasp domain-containing protein [Candidatus Binataceae bacterium]|nr:ATP-grasp domain-containing protein [Candidatus Binataceae bacterium]